MTKGTKAMMKALQEKGVKVCGTTTDFFGSKTDNKGIWVAADHTPELFDYWNHKVPFGIDVKLNAMVEKSGWYFEWYDSGTMMVWKN